MEEVIITAPEEWEVVLEIRRLPDPLHQEIIRRLLILDLLHPERLFPIEIIRE